MAWNDAIISVPCMIYRRFLMMTEEIYRLNYGVDLNGYELKGTTNQIVVNVLDEYVRQQFEEATKSVVQMAMGHQSRYQIPQLYGGAFEVSSIRLDFRPRIPMVV